MGFRQRSDVIPLTVVYLLAGLMFIGCSSGGGSLVSLTPSREMEAEAIVGEKTFSGMAIHGCPAHLVRRELMKAGKEFEAERRQLQAEQRRLQQDASALKNKIDTERSALQKTYKAKAPQPSDPRFAAENPAEAFVAAAAFKARLDEKYNADVEARIKPLERELGSIVAEQESVMGKVRSLQESHATRVFGALPQASKRWKTNAQGSAKLSVPGDEPWYIWAEGVRSQVVSVETTGRVYANGTIRSTQREGDRRTNTYRWLLEVPKDLDAAGKLFLDEHNLFDSIVVETSSSGSSGSSPNVRANR